MNHSFKSYLNRRETDKFGRKFDALCENIYRSGLTFDQFWENVGLPTLLEGYAEDEYQLIELWGFGGGKKKLQPQPRTSDWADNMDNPQDYKDSPSSSVINRNKAYTQSQWADENDPSQDSGPAPDPSSFSQTQAHHSVPKGMQPITPPSAVDMPAHTPGAPAGEFPKVPDPAAVSAPGAAASSPVDPKQQYKQQQGMDRKQKQAEAAVKDIQMRFKVAMKEFTQAVRNDAMTQNNPYLGVLANKFQQRMTDYAQRLVAQTRQGDGGFAKQFGQERQAWQDDQAKAAQSASGSATAGAEQNQAGKTWNHATGFRPGSDSATQGHTAAADHTGFDRDADPLQNPNPNMLPGADIRTGKLPVGHTAGRLGRLSANDRTNQMRRGGNVPPEQFADVPKYTEEPEDEPAASTAGVPQEVPGVPANQRQMGLAKGKSLATRRLNQIALDKKIPTPRLKAMLAQARTGNPDGIAALEAKGIDWKKLLTTDTGIDEPEQWGDPDDTMRGRDKRHLRNVMRSKYTPRPYSG